MKKTFVLLLAGMMVICLLSACGEKETITPKTQSDSTAAMPSIEETTTDVIVDTYSEVQQLFFVFAGFSLPDSSATDLEIMNADIIDGEDGRKDFNANILGSNESLEKIFNDSVLLFTEQFGKPTGSFNGEMNMVTGGSVVGTISDSEYGWIIQTDDGGSIEYILRYVPTEEPSRFCVMVDDSLNSVEVKMALNPFLYQ